ncbi:glycosyltransferase family 2 protein [Candidatus Woesearchaeota archaeon]|nr:glycosyltransferase family 2 protein [Candidatus Woesearchaeota archaeon]
MINSSLSIVVPAFNEEEHLEKAVAKYNRVAKSMFKDYEIIIFNDCSTDKTGKIADRIARKNSKVRVVHNKKNMGLGYNYRTGFKLAKKEYFIGLSGEGDAQEASVRRILKHAGKADLILSYINNTHDRHWMRRLLSRSFTIILNTLFGLKVKYYNGYVLHKTKILKKVRMSTNSFAYQAEIEVRLLKSKKYTYMEVPYSTAKTVGSSMFRIKNIIGMATTVLTLLNDIYIKKDVGVK